MKVEQHVFLVTGQVVSYFSLLIMTAAIVYSLNQRRLAGYRPPAWAIYIYIFLALDALVGVILTGFQYIDTPYFYSGRRFFSLFTILFIFLSIFEFPEKMPRQGLLSEKAAVFAFVVAQMLFNLTWLALNISNPAWMGELAWMNMSNDLLLPLNFLWMAILSRRKGLAMKGEDRLAASKTLARFSWFFWFGMLLSGVIALRAWLPFASRVHVTLSSYGWMILCALTVLIFLGFGRERSLLYSQTTLLVLLIVLLALSLMAELFHNNLGKVLPLAEIDRLMRPFILLQAGIALFIFLALPRWLGFISTEKAPRPPALMRPLTTRQQDVMRLLAEGQSNPQIAAALHVTEQTAKYHVSRLMQEQGKNDRRELGELARGLIRKKML